MKAEELKIGNLFYSINHSSEVHLPVPIAFKVLTIEVDRVKAVRSNEIPACVEIWAEFKYYDISPIPLNEEWLLRMGFIHDGGKGYKSPNNTEYWFFTLRNGFMPNTIAKCSINSDGYIGVQYIHQLQNLYYALTGTELTINE